MTTAQSSRLTQSPSWTIHPLECRNVRIEGIRIDKPADSPNTDGINPESCQDVFITNCLIDVGDDCIAIKAMNETCDADRLAPCENIVIANCIMKNGHDGVVMGSEMSGGVRNVRVSNCIFDGTERGIRLKTRRGRGGEIAHVHVSQIQMRNVICPLVINMAYRLGPGVCESHALEDAQMPVNAYTPRIHNISVGDVFATGVTGAAVYVCGLRERPVEDLALRDIAVSMVESGKTQLVANGVETDTRLGAVLTDVHGLSWARVKIRNGPDLPCRLRACATARIWRMSLL